MSRVRLYVDEDSMDQAFLRALRARGVDVRTAHDDAMIGRSDVDQLRWAAAQGRVLFSYNVADFYRLHTDCMERGEGHAGLILVQQQRYGIGEQVGAVLNLIATRSAEAMEQAVEFLSAWIARSSSSP